MSTEPDLPGAECSAAPHDPNSRSSAPKRCFDVIAATCGLVALAPVGALIALLIKLSDGGPVFFRQVRVGQFGRPFEIWKFRSMVVGAEKLGAPLTKGRDPRVTRVGRWLRATKADELPQLWNVLLGEMSFVGPRPEVGRYVDRYTPQQREILRYKPGITDLATQLFRNEESLLGGADDLEGFYLRYCLPRKIQLNLEYAQHASLLGDVWIILQTLCPYWLGVVFLYSFVLAGSFWLCYQLRSDFQVTGASLQEFKRCVAWMAIPQLVLLGLVGQLRGLVSYFSIPEMRRTLVALAIALPIQVLLCQLVEGDLAPARTIYFIDLLLAFATICGVRLGFRWWREHASRTGAGPHAPAERVAIIGTGQLATDLALTLARSPRPARKVVAFFDDNPRMWNTRPHDIPVIGMPECLLKPEWRGQLDEVVVALPEDQARRLEEVRLLLKGVPWKVTIASNWPVLRRSPQRSASEGARA